MIRTLPLLALLMASLSAHAHRVVVDGGSVHLRGALVNSACAVSPESQDLRVEMGQYRSNNFGDVGSYSTVTVPFSLKLVECRRDVASLVGIAFQGLSPAEDPQVFVATSKASGMPGETGLGLALFDARQQLIIPNAPPDYYSPIISEEMTVHFSARYRVISLPLVPGNLLTDVWFTLVYQ
ncbi:type 1 fimbrial protein subunit FimI [Enterobacter sp. CC120223-11]|uniref:type 1 fimbrial protein subunit FimI n=1 Tax=Enterobacter sp. CC120223-11 TaxID=1378073 RepID=UPI000BCD6782|nr:type 1 fimbrial protein subunit FimI [Enterobacter sp. CC120223-11]SNY62295.1 fimbrial protein [Enterobacter sp. CC120223-11]